MRKNNPDPCPGQTVPRAMVLVNGRPAPGLVLFESVINVNDSRDEFTIELKLSAQGRTDNQSLIESFPKDAFVELLVGYPPDPKDFTADDLSTIQEGLIDGLFVDHDTDELILWCSAIAIYFPLKESIEIKGERGIVKQLIKPLPKNTLHRMNFEKGQSLVTVLDCRHTETSSKFKKVNADFDEKKPFEIYLQLRWGVSTNQIDWPFDLRLQLENFRSGVASVNLGKLIFIAGVGRKYDRYYLPTRLHQAYSATGGYQTVMEAISIGPSASAAATKFAKEHHHV